MKKTLFLLLLLPLLGRGLGGGLLFAQTVSNLQVSAGTPSTVTFDVEWDKADLPALWSDTMWVFVDYNKNGKMTRMELLLGAGSTLTATSSPGVGKLVEENIKGAWVVGDARTNAAGSFSARVQLLTATADLYGACAYASSYPPVGEYVSSTEIIFSGTPMYEIWLTSADGLEMIESGSTFLLPCSYTVSSFTDATGAPGIISCIPSTDIYNLTVSATTYCAGGAVTFALDNTTSGRTYQLYRDDVAVMDELLGTGSAETFTGTFTGAGTYTAQVKDDGTYCAAQMTGTYTVSANPAPDAPVMGGSSSYCTSGTITATPGLGGSGIRWTDDNTTVSPRTVTTSGTYYAVTVSDAGCESIPAPVLVTIVMPGADGEPSTCGCATDIIDCDGTCKTAGTYTSNDGECAGCHIAYVRKRDQCGAVIDATYSTSASTCTTPNQVVNDGACANCYQAWSRLKDACGGVLQEQYGTFNKPSCADSFSPPTYYNYCTGGGSYTGLIYTNSAAECDAGCKRYACGAKYYRSVLTEWECQCYVCWQ
jgi:hypothetical protein